MPQRLHGLSGTYLANAIANIRYRCNNPNHPQFQYWGGKGVQCLINSPQEILDAIGHRPTPAHSIDRIDGNGHYEIGNIRWADTYEQLDNRDITTFVTYKGETKSSAQLARENNLPPNIVKARLNLGWEVEKALETPVRTKGKLISLNGKSQTINEWAHEIGIHRKSLTDRIERWGVEKALTTPARKLRKPAKQQQHQQQFPLDQDH